MQFLRHLTRCNHRTQKNVPIKTFFQMNDIDERSKLGALDFLLARRRLRTSLTKLNYLR